MKIIKRNIYKVHTWGRWYGKKKKIQSILTQYLHDMQRILWYIILLRLAWATIVSELLIICTLTPTLTQEKTIVGTKIVFNVQSVNFYTNKLALKALIPDDNDTI